jgi:hypothetical protein
MTSNNNSINCPPSFNGEGYGYWKERMKIFIEGIDCDIWDAIENGPFIPTHLVNNVVVNKPRSLWTKDEKKKVQYNLKAKNIITASLSIDEFYRVSNCTTAKEMWDTLKLTHEGTTEVKRARMNTLTHEYELFRMKSGESIQDMQKRFIHIINHLRALGKSFNNEDLINKILRCLSRSWLPKVTAICESKDLSFMSLATLFGKLQEHELELNRLVESEEGEKKKNGLALKARNNERTSFNPKCYKCGEKGHIKSNCPINQKRYTKGKRAYITWDDKDTNSCNESTNEVAYSCFMANNEEDEVNSIESEYDLTYDELFTICKELNDESTKLRKIVSTSKKTISTLESKIDILNKEIEILKEKQVFVSEVSSCTYCENKKENILKCDDCNILKIEIEDLQNTLAKFTMGRENLNIILGNQKGTYNKAGLGYHPKNHEKLFRKFFRPNKTSSSPFVKCFYCGREGHTSSICNLRKNNDMNGKWKWIPKGTLPNANSQGPKMFWVPKAKT